MSPGVLAVLFVVFVFLAGVSGVFSAMQTALFSIKPFALRRLAGEDSIPGRRLRRLLLRPQDALGAILIVDLMANVPLILVCIYALREFPVAGRFPVLLASLVTFGIVVVLCDLLPKLLGLARPLQTARLTVGALSAVMPVVAPVNRLLQRWCDRIASALTPERMKPRVSLTEDEFETLVEVGEEEGALRADEGMIIQEILKLSDKTAKDCMTPRVDMTAVADDSTPQEVAETVRISRFRRLPVFNDTPDNIVGILDAGEFLRYPAIPFTTLMKQPRFVPETMLAMDLLVQFLTGGDAMAVVVDEYGGTEGIVTLADLVEDIISGAVPSGEHALEIEDAGDGRYLVSGSARLDDLGERLGVDLEMGGIDTIAGLIFNHLGYLPKASTRLDIPPLACVIRRCTRKRIEEVLVWVPDADGPEDAESGKGPPADSDAGKSPGENIL